MDLYVHSPLLKHRDNFTFIAYVYVVHELAQWRTYETVYLFTYIIGKPNQIHEIFC
jgi:hypothetical protein